MAEKKKPGFMAGIKKVGKALVNAIAPDLVDTEEIKKIIKEARSVTVKVSKDIIPGPFKDKHVASIVYKIGDVTLVDGFVSYKTETFQDSKISSLIKRRAIELNPDAVAKCEKEAETWKQSSKTRRISKTESR